MKKLIVLFIIAFLLRLGLIFSAYHGDLNNNISWGSLAVERGLSGFYGSADANDWPYSAPNQPPLTLLMLVGAREVWQVVRNTVWYLNWEVRIFPSKLVWFWDEKGMTLLVKMPSVLADLATGWLIYKYIRKKKDHKKALLVSSVWLFNPVIWYNSSVWGQTDAVVNFLGLYAVLKLLNKDLIKFSLLFVLSLLFKGSLAIFVPVLLFIAIKQKYSVEKWIKSGLLILVTIFAISIWFHPELDFFSWFFELYKNRILPGEIGYLTANSFNFWWLVDPGFTLDSTVYFGLTARIWGLLISLTFILLILIWLNKKLNEKRIFFSLAMSAFVIFLFMTRIHERYLYPLFPYLTLLLAFIPGIFTAYVILSFGHLLNLYHMFWAPSLPVVENLLSYALVPNVLAVLNIIILTYFLRLLSTSKI